MKKYFWVISIVLISFLAIGCVSAEDNYNMTDDSPLSVNNDELNDFEVNSENSIVENQGDVLSEGDVGLDDITVVEGDSVSIPFKVSNSNGSSAGKANIIVSGENNTVSNHIEITDAQSDINIFDLIEIINAKDADISQLQDIISSLNFTDSNISQIIGGLADIDRGFDADISKVISGVELIADGTSIDSERLIEGIEYIVNAIDMNVSEFIRGFGNVISGVEINDSAMSKVSDMIISIVGGFDIDESRLLDNVLDSIVVNRALFVSGITGIFSSLGGGSSISSIQDLMSRLKIDISLLTAIKMGILASKTEFTMLDVANVARDIWNHNHLTMDSFLDRLNSFSNGFSFSLADVIDNIENSKTNSGDFNKIIKSLRINNDKLANSIAIAIDEASFNKSKVAFELANITGIDSVKLLNVIDAVSDIVQGFKLDAHDVIFGIKDVLSGLGSANFIDLNDLFSAVSFDEASFTGDFDSILADFNLTRADISVKIHEMFDYFNLTVSDDLDNRLSDSINSKKLNFTDVGVVFKDILLYNDLTISDFRNLLNDSNGFDLNVSTIIHRLANSNFELSSIINNILRIMRYVNVDYDKISTAIESMGSFDASYISDAISRIIGDAKFNASIIVAGINRIAQEIDYDSSQAIDYLESNININSSKIFDGFSMIQDSISIDKSRADIGFAKILSAFTFNRNKVQDGIDRVSAAFALNTSMISQGICKVAYGFGINVSDFISKLVSRFGYVSNFQHHLAPGTYNVTVEYAGKNHTSKLTVLPKKDSVIRYDVLVDGYHVHITGSMDKDAKGLVVFEIGDYDVYALVVNGNVAFDDTFAPGNYVASATYLGDLKFAKNSTQIPFTVKMPTSVSVSSLTTVYGTSKNIVIALNDVNGKAVSDKKLTVKFNGKTYSPTTDPNGKVSIAVSGSLKPNTYQVSIAFAGDDVYVKSDASTKVVVSKATPKITASAKTFKKSVKIKKYTITLKNNKNKVMKNVKVTIKVKGKTYSAKTDSKGKATFKITKLTKKGTFKATVTYSGNAYYAKVSKTANIKIK